MNLTAIFACKDRLDNLQYCLSSIASSNQIPNVIVVDFGSAKNFKYLEKKYPWLGIIEVKRTTQMFHKTRALNIGIKAAKTKYVCLTDVDQIFQPNFFPLVFETLQSAPNVFVRCKTYFLPTLPNYVAPYTITPNVYFKLLSLAKRKMIKKPHGEGCCHGTSHKHLMEINGHDENYIGWGFEDKDLALRLGYYGAKTIWVDHITSMLHLPHSRDAAYFSYTARKQNEDRYYAKTRKMQIKTNLNMDWGQL